MGAIGHFLIGLLPYLFVGVLCCLGLIFMSIFTYAYIADGEHPKRKSLRALILLAIYSFVGFLISVAAFNL